MTVQTSYPATPPDRAAGMIVNTFGSPQFISRAVSTRQLEELTFGTTDGTYTVTIDGAEVASFAASSDTAEAIRDEILTDLLAAGIVAEEGTTVAKLIIEAPRDGADDGFVIAISVVTGYVLLNFVEHAQEVAFGLGLVRDDRAPGTERRARLPRLATDVSAGLFLGVAAMNTNREPNVNGWPHLSTPDIMRVGHIYVIVEDTGLEGENLFVRHAVDTGDQIGAFRNDIDTASCVAVPGLRAMEDWTAAGVIAAEYFPNT